jgi:hypothetical protein
MILSIVARVPKQTPDRYNEANRRPIHENIAHYDAGPEAIDRRLEELDQEWDIERTPEANASSLVLVGLATGTCWDRRFDLLPAAVAGFLLQHAVQGWCPLVPLFRHLGVRTASEIDEERYTLKALRGVFRDVPTGDGPDPDGIEQVLQAVRR